MKRSVNWLPACVLAVTFGMVSVGQSAVIYLNNFGNNTSGYLAVSNESIGWSMLRATTGGTISNDSSLASSRGGVNYSTGRLTDVSNVNAPVSLSNTTGVAFISNASSTTYTALFYTDQYVVDRSLYDIDSFQWYANATTSDTTQRVAIQIDGLWYVSSTITPGTGSFGTFSSANLYTIDFDTTLWYSLSATVGSTFSISTTSVSLPTGNISAFGLYLDAGPTGNTYSRFDTFTINATAVPEPGTVGLLGLAACLYLLKRRRTREA